MHNKCNTCYQQIHADCNFNQGRCPHRIPLINTVGLWNKITNYFNKFKGKETK